MRKFTFILAIGVALTLVACGSGSTANQTTDSTAVSTDSTAYPTLVGSSSSTGQSPFIDSQHLYYDGSSNVLNVAGGANVGVLTATRLSVPGTIVQVVTFNYSTVVSVTGSYASTGLSTSISLSSEIGRAHV